MAELSGRPKDAPYDTVLLRGGLARVANLARMLDVAMARLAAKGRMIVAVPLDMSDAGRQQGQSPPRRLEPAESGALRATSRAETEDGPGE